MAIKMAYVILCRQLSSRPTKQELEAKHIIISE